MSSHIRKTHTFAELETRSGHIVAVPFVYPEVAWFTSAKALARRLQTAMQSALLDQGLALEFARCASVAEVTPGTVTVEFAAGGKPALQPACSLRYPAFFWRYGAYYCGLAPSLGVQVFADDEAAVQATLGDAIRIEHLRSQRLTDPRRLLPGLWYRTVQTSAVTLDFIHHTPAELAELLHGKRERWLPRVAQAVSPLPYAVVDVAALLDDLSRALQGPAAGSVLLVGPQGCGKTALVQAYAAQCQRCGTALPLSTTAARLVQVLTQDSGWQAPLAALCRELRDSPPLWVGQLTELFEVGRYIGNVVSLGEALREPLARGEIQLLAECTEEQLAALDLHYPGYSALFQQIRFPQRSDAELAHIVQHTVSALARQYKLSLADDGVAEVIRLQRRFAPYAGFPGKTIRFLESLILQQVDEGNLGSAEVLQAFCEESGVPRLMVDPAQALDADATLAFFQQRVFGQPEAARCIRDLLLAVKADLARPGKPIAALLLIGPTGVGKTEMAKALAQFMFGDAQRLTRFDMSEYADATAVLRLTGEWHGSDGALVTRIRAQPFSVVLFDEIEKADPSFFDLLLQILGEGRLTGADGELANFCSSLIVLTSNLGADALQARSPGLHPQAEPSLQQHFTQAVESHFRPELFNRLDHLLAFRPLDAAQRSAIVAREMALLQVRPGIAERPVALCPQPDLATHLEAALHDHRYGARQVQRVVQQRLAVPLAYALNALPAAAQAEIDLVADADQVCAAARILPGHAERAGMAATIVNLLAGSRRTLQAMIDGPVVLQARTQWQLLEKHKARLAKKRKLEQFWADGPRAEAWRNYHQMFELIEQYQQRATELEGRALRQLLLPDAADLGLAQAGRELEWNLVDLARSVASAACPGDNRCLLVMFGPVEETTALLQRHLQLAQQIDHRVDVCAVAVKDQQHQRLDYPLSAAVAAGKPNLCGYLLAISGACAWQFWNTSTGYWRFVVDGKARDVYIEQRRGELKHYQIPHDVHRKPFLQDKEQIAEVKHGQLQHINFDAPMEWQLAPWAQALSERFADIIVEYLEGAR